MPKAPPKSIVTYLTEYPLTLTMLRLLSSKAQECKDFWKTSKPCHVGIHWIALTEYSQMSTHVPGFQSFHSFFVSLWIGQTIATSSLSVKYLKSELSDHISIIQQIQLNNPFMSVALYMMASVLSIFFPFIFTSNTTRILFWIKYILTQ